MSLYNTHIDTAYAVFAIDKNAMQAANQLIINCYETINGQKEIFLKETPSSGFFSKKTIGGEFGSFLSEMEKVYPTPLPTQSYPESKNNP